MAIDLINSQGTTLYVVPESTDTSDCTAIETALASAKVIGCPQTIGDLQESRSVTEYKCLDSNETTKSFGSITRGSLDIEMLLNPDDTEGQSELKTAFADNTPVKIIIELPNPTTAGTGHGTLYEFTSGISSVTTGIPVDEAIKYTVTLEIASVITECPAT